MTATAKRKRKSFLDPEAARAFEEAQKHAARPKKSGRGPTIAVVLAPLIKAGIHSTNYWAAKTIIALYGQICPSDLGATHVDHLNAGIAASKSPFTRCNRSAADRRDLRKLYEDHCASRLAERVVKSHAPRPRNITATTEERNTILTAAQLHMRLWLLIFSDMSMRAGSAASIAPDQYDAATRAVTFSTKYDARQTLTVTTELAELMNPTGLVGSEPYVAQLARRTARGKYHRPNQPGGMPYNTLARDFKALRERLGITRKLTAHDLRRTTATRVYAATKRPETSTGVARPCRPQLNAVVLGSPHHAGRCRGAGASELNPTTEVIQ